MKEQTAVEWLYNNLNLCFDKFDNGEYSYTEFINASKEVKEQAKEMEKENLIKFYIKGCDDTYGMDEEDDDIKDAKKHYKEIFKSE